MLAVALILPPVSILPVALIMLATRRLPTPGPLLTVKLPTCASPLPSNWNMPNRMLPPVILPDALTVVAATAPTKLPPCTLPVVLILPDPNTAPAAVTLPARLRPFALEKVATAVGVIAPDTVVNICMLVALLVSVKASAATMSTRPLELFPNCKSPMLNPRPVN